ncbi:MAG: GIY-YIG nuclease family protein, partial [Lachnospiraceae bacterium]
GIFISMDSYQGSIYDPVTLHKYLYANANPVMYTDPSGYMGLKTRMIINAELSASEIVYNAVVLTIGISLIRMLKEKIASVSARYNYVYAVDIALEELDLTSDIDIAVNKVKTVVIDITKESTKKICCYSVYTLVDDDGNVRYVGRTKNYSKRMLQHKRNGGVMQKYGLKEGTLREDGLTYEQARGIEQTWMVWFHTRNWLSEGGYNKINGISENNNNKQLYYDETVSFFENQVDNEYLNLLENIGMWW